jgi:flagellar protein FliO/FliZ
MVLRNIFIGTALVLGLFAAGNAHVVVAEEHDVESAPVAESAPLAVSAPVTARAPVKESEIPVLVGKKAEPASSSSPFFRLILGIVVLSGLAGGLIVFARWWNKKQAGAAPTQRIQLVSQLHLNPRKSLAVVRVAGESVLIGITDQNINLLKTLTLLDDETDTASARTFVSTLAEKNQNDEDRVLDKIKDRITQKTKELGAFQ